VRDFFAKQDEVGHDAHETYEYADCADRIGEYAAPVYHAKNYPKHHDH
jgi:hypothetical protein